MHHIYVLYIYICMFIYVNMVLSITQSFIMHLSLQQIKKYKNSFNLSHFKRKKKRRLNCFSTSLTFMFLFTIEKNRNKTGTKTPMFTVVENGKTNKQAHRQHCLLLKHEGKFMFLTFTRKSLRMLS